MHSDCEGTTSMGVFEFYSGLSLFFTILSFGEREGEILKRDFTIIL